jgi:hypothetical protein
MVPQIHATRRQKPFRKLPSVRWGIGLALLAVVLGLVVPAGAAAEAPTYEEAPVYSPAPPTRKLRLHFAGFRRNLRSGTAILFVQVPGPGRVILHGRGIRRRVRYVSQPRRLRLVVRPKVRLMRYLKHHRKGIIRAAITFRPDDGSDAQTIERPIALKRRHRRH